MLLIVPVGAAIACATGGDDAGFGEDNDGSGGAGATDASGATTDVGGGTSFGDDATSDGPHGDPETCAQAEQWHSYIGCDYWPTVTANVVWSVFDFAVVVANAGHAPANVTVTGPNGTNQAASVPAGQLAKIYLPWVPNLKGGDSDMNGSAVPMSASVFEKGGAYHLVSDKPVTVYQFDALEYKGQGGPPGKDWSNCPGNASGLGCFSFTNDASLLLPSSAMTGHYRIAGYHAWQLANMGPYFVVTATANGTNVTVKLSSTAQIFAGGPIPQTSAGGTFTLQLDAGDVAEVVSPGSSDAVDLSGSLVSADKPVQVITGIPCVYVPSGAQACDHTEESNFPAETLGKDYVVVTPTGPNGNAVGHVVRIVGNFDGTTLTYSPGNPGSCPTALDAGQVVECGVVSQDFEVKGNKPFAVATFLQGASVVDPGNQPPAQKGDPSQSLATAVEQYRTKYIFLAPDDYDVNYVDIVAPQGAGITVDAQGVTGGAPIGGSGFSEYRVKLGPGQAGAHVLEATQPVGIQVVGYGSYTSYWYPGGLDLAQIAPPPPK